MKDLKIGIYKKIEVDNQGHYRWYGADYNPKKHNKKRKPKLPVISLNKLKYDFGLESEKDFCRFLYNTWGNGEYMILGYKHPIFVFWKGSIDSQGFKFYKNTISQKDINFFKRIHAEEMYEGDLKSARETKEMIQKIKEEEKELKSGKRYGFYQFLKASSRRGSKLFWNDKDIENNEEKDWGITKKDINFEKFGEVKKRDFEEW